MALNPDLAGKTYPPADPYQVGREKIREFATAIGDANPAYHDVSAARALGHPDVIAPPTFAFSITHRAMLAAMLDPELGLDYSRVVHGEQSFNYARPIVAGDTLIATGTIESIRSVAGNDLLTTRADLVTEDGEHVATTHSVIVSRGTAAEEA